MFFTKLKLNYFGQFHNKEIELKPGINLIYGENEAGKSTVHTFIKGMLFGIERLRGRGSASKEDLYTRYLPWDYPGAFNGSMEIELGEKKYRLQRSFHANDKSFTVMDLSTGREVKLKEGHISELLPGLTETTFRNTISLEQLKAQTDSELALQVRNYIANLSVSKSKEVNVAKAVSSLTEQKKPLEPSQSMAALKLLQTAIEEGLSKEDRMDELTLRLRGSQDQEQVLLEKKEALSKPMDLEAARKMEELPAITEKFHSYQELTKTVAQLRTQIEDLKGKLVIWEKEQQSTTSINEERIAAETLRMEMFELEKQETELLLEKVTLNKAKKKSFYYGLLPAAVLAQTLLFATGFAIYGIILAITILAAGFVGAVLLQDKNKKRLQDQEAKSGEVTKNKASTQSRLDEILRKYQVNNIEQLSEKQGELLKSFYALEHAREQQQELLQRKNELEDSQDAIYDTIMKYLLYFIPAEELTAETMQRLQTEIRLRKQERDAIQAEHTREYNACKLDMERLKWEISTLEGNEEELLRNQDRYAELEQQRNENATELEAIKLALTSIQELSADIHDSFGQQLNLEVSKVINEVTTKKYNDLKIDEKLEVKVGWNGDYVLLERLSAGTIDQVYFALRLAVADLLLGKGKAPILLDDSFTLYDDKRVKAALTEVAKRKQIILFTCHKREQKLLEELGLPYHLVDLSYQS